MNKSNQEILDIAQEEAAEVITAISKVRRFGLDSIDPRLSEPISNQKHLATEVGDTLAMFRLMISAGIIDWDDVNVAAEAKITKLRQWSSIDSAVLDSIQ